ncbi:MAG: hypothetical protein CL472_07595 [Acidobacteria bacterium]|nr:hypothetical protein [Acidobacteriota bacterium]
MTFTASHVRSIRSRFGFSMMDAKRACQIGEERFSGDHELGARWILANQLAVNVRGGPEARALYNDKQARAAKAREEALKA